MNQTIFGRCGQNSPTQSWAAFAGRTELHCASLSRIPGALVNPSYFWHFWDREHVWAGEVRRMRWETAHWSVRANWVICSDAVQIHIRVCAALRQHDWLHWEEWAREEEERGRHMEAINASSWFCNVAQQTQDDMHVFWAHNKKNKDSQLFFTQEVVSLRLTSAPCQIWGSLSKFAAAFSTSDREWKMQESAGECFQRSVRRAANVKSHQRRHRGSPPANSIYWSRYEY